MVPCFRIAMGVQAGGVMRVRICAINGLSALECYPSNTTHVWAGTFEDKHQNGTDFPHLASNRVRRLKGAGPSLVDKGM